MKKQIPRQPVVRFQVEITEQRMKKIEELMFRCGLRTKREFCDYAVEVIEWAIEETAKGDVVGVQGSNGVFSELRLPPLTNLRVIMEAEAKVS